MRILAKSRLVYKGFNQFCYLRLKLTTFSILIPRMGLESAFLAIFDPLRYLFINVICCISDDITTKSISQTDPSLAK